VKVRLPKLSYSTVWVFPSASVMRVSLFKLLCWYAVVWLMPLTVVVTDLTLPMLSSLVVSTTPSGRVMVVVLWVRS
jgi:hypothetical protein